MAVRPTEEEAEEVAWEGRLSLMVSMPYVRHPQVASGHAGLARNLGLFGPKGADLAVGLSFQQN